MWLGKLQSPSRRLFGPYRLTGPALGLVQDPDEWLNFLRQF